MQTVRGAAPAAQRPCADAVLSLTYCSKDPAYWLNRI